jgi:DNA processing protein
VSACAPCLRRSMLIGLLAAPIASLLDSRRAAPGILTLPEPRLLALVGEEWRGRAGAELRRFDPDAMRADVEREALFAVCRHDPGYPERLADLPDPPAVLYGRGSQARFAELLGEPAVAVVGTRRASSYGLEVARELGRAQRPPRGSGPPRSGP